MPIFKINGTKLNPIQEVNFDLEKEIQNLVEQNVESVFGLEFVCSEFAHNKLRIDTLAFNHETNSFVLIEYKRDKNRSVVDQGYAYLSLMLQNKAEFILVYQEKTKKLLDRKTVDWEQSKVIFIANDYTSHQLQAIQFKGLPMELWEVVKYDNNTVLFNQIQSAQSGEPITTISKDKTVQSVSKEIKKYTVEDHIKPEATKTKELFDLLQEKLLLLDQRIIVSAVKNYIGFYIGWKIICSIYPRSAVMYIN